MFAMRAQQAAAQFTEDCAGHHTGTETELEFAATSGIVQGARGGNRRGRGRPESEKGSDGDERPRRRQGNRRRTSGRCSREPSPGVTARRC